MIAQWLKMIAEKSLLGRINSDTNTRSLKFNYASLHYSILNSLQKMLNVRKGSLISSDDYGMPDFSRFISQFPDAIHTLKMSIREYLHQYEPRIQSVQISHDPDPDKPLELKFNVTTRLLINEEMQNMSFETVLTSTGQAIIRS